MSDASHTPMARLASLHRRLRRRLRAAILRALAPFTSYGAAPPPDLRACRRVLLVSLNQRLGNTVLATSAAAVLAAALPHAHVSFLGGRHASPLLRGFRIARVYSVGRSLAWKPWQLVSLVSELRSEHFDAAIHLSTSTGSFGALLVGASGAKHRLGVRREDGNVFFTSAVEPPAATHKVDQLFELIGTLGIEAKGERTMVFEPHERAAARRFLAATFGAPTTPVAVFVGSRARKGKTWPLANYACVVGGLRERGIPSLVFLGPEERAREAEIRAALGTPHVVQEADLRRVAALASECRAVLTPDAGPMHLAIAAGAPTVAVFVRPNFARWGPRPPRGRVVYDPDGTRAEEALGALLELSAGVA